MVTSTTRKGLVDERYEFVVFRIGKITLWLGGDNFFKILVVTKQCTYQDTAKIQGNECLVVKGKEGIDKILNLVSLSFNAIHRGGYTAMDGIVELLGPAC